MNALRRFGLVLLIAWLVGCAAGEHSSYRKSEQLASQIYTAGSSFGGDGVSLLLLDDCRWQKWHRTCLGSAKVSQGRFKRSGDTLTLFQKDQPPLTYQVLRKVGGGYVLTPRNATAVTLGDSGRGFILTRQK